MTITVDDVKRENKGELITLDTVREALGATEPFNSVIIDVGPKVKFRLGTGWAHDVDTKLDSDIVDATVEHEGTEYRLTKEALINAANLAHISSAYLKITPADLMELHLNYWWRAGLAPESFQMLTMQNRAVAFTKDTITPFSILRLLDNVLEGVEAKYGTGEVMADYKFYNSLTRTDLRLIIPEKTRVITNTGTDNDTWSVGLHVYNSLRGKGQTQIGGYLYRYACTNGAQDMFNKGDTWNRKSDGQGDDVFEWAKEQVDGILGGLEHSLDKVQELTTIDASDSYVQVLIDLYNEYGIPAKDRLEIDYAANSADNITMYSVMQAVTQAANFQGLKPAQVDRLLRAGGNLPHTAHNRCEACHHAI